MRYSLKRPSLLVMTRFVFIAMQLWLVYAIFQQKKWKEKITQANEATAGDDEFLDPCLLSAIALFQLTLSTCFDSFGQYLDSFCLTGQEELRYQCSDKKEEKRQRALTTQTSDDLLLGDDLASLAGDEQDKGDTICHLTFQHVNDLILFFRVVMVPVFFNRMDIAITDITYEKLLDFTKDLMLDFFSSAASYVVLLNITSAVRFFSSFLFMQVDNSKDKDGNKNWLKTTSSRCLQVLLSIVWCVFPVFCPFLVYYVFSFSSRSFFITGQFLIDLAAHANLVSECKFSLVSNRHGLTRFIYLDNINITEYFSGLPFNSSVFVPLFYQNGTAPKVPGSRVLSGLYLDDAMSFGFNLTLATNLTDVDLFFNKSSEAVRVSCQTFGLPAEISFDMTCFMAAVVEFRILIPVLLMLSRVYFRFGPKFSSPAAERIMRCCAYFVSLVLLAGFIGSVYLKINSPDAEDVLGGSEFPDFGAWVWCYLSPILLANPAGVLHADKEKFSTVWKILAREYLPFFFKVLPVAGFLLNSLGLYLSCLIIDNPKKTGETNAEAEEGLLPDYNWSFWEEGSTGGNSSSLDYDQDVEPKRCCCRRKNSI